MAFWDIVQLNSDKLLAEGLHRLMISESRPGEEDLPDDAGNYVFLDGENALFAGEAGNLQRRISAQLDEGKSRFYKRYLQSSPDEVRPLSEMTLRYIPVVIGRKELEEYVIVNLGSGLNREPSANYWLSVRAGVHDFWDRIQKKAADLLNDGSSACLEAEPVRWRNRSVLSTAGVFIIRNRNDEIIRICEAANLAADLKVAESDSHTSDLRYAIGTDQLGFQAVLSSEGRRGFQPNEEEDISRYLHRCTIAQSTVGFGRLEIANALSRQIVGQKQSNRKKDAEVAA